VFYITFAPTQPENITRSGLFLWLSLCFFAVLTLQGLLAYYQVGLLQVRFLAPDPAWTAFPNKCSPNGHNLPIINCVRVGNGIPNATMDFGQADSPIIYQGFNATVANVQAMFEDILTAHFGCRMISSSTGFIHARCLSQFQGFPDDVAIKIFCANIAGENVANVWIHSQSRLGVWDFNFNDARIREIFGYIALSLGWCTGELITPGTAPWSCFTSLQPGKCV